MQLAVFWDVECIACRWSKSNGRREMALLAKQISQLRVIIRSAISQQQRNGFLRNILSARHFSSNIDANKKMPRNVKCTSTNDSLRVEWDDGDHSSYPFIFLRDNCQCESCFHVSAKQRSSNIVASVPVDIKPTSLCANDDEVHVKWEDGHQSRFSHEWLRERMFPKSEKDVRSRSDCGLKPVIWGSKLANNIPAYDFGKVMEDDAAFLSWLEDIAVTGLTLLENTPITTEALSHVRNRLACSYRSSHYGEVFAVKNKLDPSNLAYTAGYLALHTDLTYYRYKPGIQLLHCIQQTDGKGGENHFVDGFNIAEELRTQEPEAFNILSTVKFMFGDVGSDIYGDFDKKCERAVIGLDNFGMVDSIAHNNYVRCSFINSPAETVKKAYDAYYKLVKTMYEPENLVTYKQKSGDVVAFNNKRVLHGRAAFEATSPRHLQGCYFDWDEVYSAIRIFRKKVGRGEVD